MLRVDESVEGKSSEKFHAILKEVDDDFQTQFCYTSLQLLSSVEVSIETTYLYMKHFKSTHKTLCLMTICDAGN